MAGKRAKNNLPVFLGKLILFVFLSMVLVAGTLVCIRMVPGVQAEAKEVMPGVSVEGVDLSNLERWEGIDRLLELESKVSDTAVVLIYGGAEYRSNLGKLGATVNREQTMDRALALGNELGVFKRWYAGVRPVERSMPFVVNLDREKLRQELQALFGALEREPIDAELQINNNDVVEVRPAQNGYQVDVNLLADQLTVQSEISNGITIKVPVRSIKPELTTQQVHEWGITGLVAEYTTRFNPEQKNRNHNIGLAADKLDGWMGAPDEVFSFNRVVGPRGVEQGYRMANVVIGNKLEEGLGGGICQVSTTLYNAVLLADLTVEQRGNHNIAVGYVPAGRDAAVAYDYMDMKFVNNSGRHVLIKTFISGNELTVKVYGKPQPEKTVQIKSWVTKITEPETVYEVDDEVEPGATEVVQKGARGYQAAAERVVLVDGREVRREALPGSKYQMVEHIIAVNSEAEIPKVGSSDDKSEDGAGSDEDEPTDTKDEPSSDEDADTLISTL